MKRLIITSTLIIATVAVYGQAIKKDAFIRLQTLTITLNPGITMEEFKEFYLNKVIPDYQRNIPEVKFYLVKAIRGEEDGRLAVLWIVESDKIRDKYHNADGSLTEAGKEAWKKRQPVQDQLNKMATIATKYTDWMV